MAFTRFNYDKARTNKRLQENMDISLYQSNVQVMALILISMKTLKYV